MRGRFDLELGRQTLGKSETGGVEVAAMALSRILLRIRIVALLCSVVVVHTIVPAVLNTIQVFVAVLLTALVSIAFMLCRTGCMSQHNERLA